MSAAMRTLQLIPIVTPAALGMAELEAAEKEIQDAAGFDWSAWELRAAAKKLIEKRRGAR